MALEAVEVAAGLVEVVAALEVVLVEEWAVGMDLEDFRMRLSLLSLLTSVDWLLEKVGGKNMLCINIAKNTTRLLMAVK